MKRIRKLALGALSAGVLAALPMGASAESIQLGFVLDSSGSIGSSNWSIITNGLASAMDVLLTGADTYEVTVVSFSTTASIVLLPTVVNAGNIASVKSTIQSASFLNGATNFDAAFTAMQSALTGSSNFSEDGKSYVNFATDGVPNRCGTTTITSPGTSASEACGKTARDNLITAGVDNISVEGIGSGVNATYLQNDICYPQACDTSAPFNFATQGFYIAVADAQGYANAIANKIRIVTGQVPEPASLALVGLALAGIGGLRLTTRNKSVA